MREIKSRPGGEVTADGRQERAWRKKHGLPAPDVRTIREAT